MSKFDRRIARKSGLSKDFVCIHNDDFIAFIYSFSLDYQKFLISKNPAIEKFLLPLTIGDFYKEFYLKHCMGFEETK